MRLRSLHPCYLDSKWLVALWRETLLAKHVLEGKTTWYRHHPQLNRFKASNSPLGSINSYLQIIFDESLLRWYHFDNTKIDTQIMTWETLSVTDWQVLYELERLREKLSTRDLECYMLLPKKDEEISLHPLFVVKPWPIEEREVIKDVTKNL